MNVLGQLLIGLLISYLVRQRVCSLTFLLIHFCAGEMEYESGLQT